MNDNDFDFDFDLFNDGEFTLIGQTFLLTVALSLAQYIVHILFNHKKKGGSNND